MERGGQTTERFQSLVERPVSTLEASLPRPALVFLPLSTLVGGDIPTYQVTQSENLRIVSEFHFGSRLRQLVSK